VLHRFAGRGELDWVAPDHHLTEEQQAHLIEGTPVPVSTSPEPVPGADAQLTPADMPLLDALAQDGRASWAALADATGWSQRQAAQRVTELAASAAIYFHLDVSDVAIGKRVSANLWFTIAPAHLEAAGRKLADHPELTFVAAVTGGTNLMASARLPDAEALYRFLTSKVAEVPGVLTVETVPQMLRLKQSHSLMADGLVLAPPV
jgi:DNA-binding Lrp family transcriptional regulator